MCDSSTMSESDGSLYPAEDNVTVCGLCTFQPPDAPGPCQPIVLPCRRAFCRRCLASLLQATAAKCNDRCSERNNQDDGVDGKDKCRTVRDGQGNLPEVKTDTAILQSWKAQSVIPFRVGLKFIEATSTSPSTFHSSVAKRIHRIPPSTQRTDELNPVTNELKPRNPIMQLPPPTLDETLPSMEEEVFVTRVWSQESFFVQRKSDFHEICTLSNLLNREGDSTVHLDRPPLQGEYLMAKFSQDCSWYRCRVDSVLSPDKVVVFYVDSGERERLPVQNLRPLPPSVYEFPIFGIECCLALDPAAIVNKKWFPRASTVFKLLFNSERSSFLMRALGRRNGLMEVTLALRPCPYIDGDAPISASDILTFLGFIDGPPPLIPSRVRNRRVLKMREFLCHSTKKYRVTISYVTRLSLFYVHLADKQQILQELQRDLDGFYKEYGDMMRVGPLASGMIVVAEFPQDKKKYRAKVVEVLTPKSIRVYFIDYGNECNVPWTNVFKLPDTFLQEPEMALECSLKLVGEPDLTSEEQAQFFYELTSDRLLLMSFEPPLQHGRPEVILEDIARASNINDEVQKYLDSCNQKECSLDDFSSDTTQSPREYVVTHLESPSEVWVRPMWLKTSWAKFERSLRLRDDATSTETHPDLSVGCSVMLKVGGRHLYRGKVEEVVGEDATVRLVDVGKKVQAPLSSLRPMAEEVAQTNAFCHCVSLSGVRPVGTSDGKWSMVAKERFADLIKELRNVYITLQGQAFEEDGISKLPVQMQYSEYVTEDPFLVPKKVMVDFAARLKLDGLVLTCQNSWERSGEVSGEESLRGWCEEDPGPGCKSTLSNLQEGCQSAQWLPPLLQSPLHAQFRAKVTYIDDEAQIYVQTADHAIKAQDMEEKLMKAVAGSLGEGESEDEWQEDDICAAEYSFPTATTWCRGRVVRVLTDHEKKTFDVLFVDYGERRLLSTKEIRRQIPLELLSVPIQVLRCKLANVVPVGGRYEKKFLDEIHPIIMDKEVMVGVTLEEKRFPLPAIIHLVEDGTSLERKFCDLGACERMKSRQQWYDPEAVKRQEAMALGIQPVTQD